MSMTESHLRRRLSHLESECDMLARAGDNLSLQLQEAYRLLQAYEPAFVAEKLGIPYTAPAADSAGPSCDQSTACD